MIGGEHEEGVPAIVGEVGRETGGEVVDEGGVAGSGKVEHLRE